MTNLYCVAIIAKVIDPKQDDFVNIQSFVYESCNYQLLIDININQFLKDVRQCPDFCLRTKTNHYDINSTYLSLFFAPPQHQQAAVNISVSRHRLLGTFFNLYNTTACANVTECETNSLTDDEPMPEIDNKNIQSTEDDTQQRLSEVSISSIYSMLRDAHLGDTIPNRVSGITENLTANLNPELRFYQKDALNWMLHRELDSEFNSTEFRPVSCIKDKRINEQQNHIFYFNARTLQLLDWRPEDLKIPTGGILADEMGLGKTVEMLALILSNRKKIQEQSNIEKIQVKKSKLYYNTLGNIFC